MLQNDHHSKYAEYRGSKIASQNLDLPLQITIQIIVTVYKSHFMGWDIFQT